MKILPKPNGWDIVEEHGNGAVYRKPDELLLAIVDSSDEHGDGRTWIHLSLSTPTKPPTFDQLKAAKEAFLGDRYAVQVFPPRRYWVSIHPHVLHLWATDDPWPLPEFGKYGSL